VSVEHSHYIANQHRKHLHPRQILTHKHKLPTSFSSFPPHPRSHAPTRAKRSVIGSCWHLLLQSTLLLLQLLSLHTFPAWHTQLQGQACSCGLPGGWLAELRHVSEEQGMHSAIIVSTKRSVHLNYKCFVYAFTAGRVLERTSYRCKIERLQAAPGHVSCSD
jgi:hypothetical protein